ncbi:MAG: acetylglutamate kinase [Anaerolineales bacterium]
MQVIKISGKQLDEVQFLDTLAQVLSELPEQTIIVHGGGREIGQLQYLYDVQPTFVDGLRVTDEMSLEIVKMVLCGAVNPRIVELLGLLGIEAQGLSGLDRGLMRAKKLEHPEADLGYVGEVVSVRTDILHALLADNVLPVIAPICLGDAGTLNVNADHVAGAVGRAMNADRVVFISNVPGVLHKNRTVPRLTVEMVEDYIEQGIIAYGMVPKVRTACDLLRAGVKEILITSMEGLRANVGTRVVME